MGGGSSVSTHRTNYCIDFLRGNCRWQNCRFSHDPPGSVLARAHVRERRSTKLDICSSPSQPNPRSAYSGSSSGPGNLNVGHNREVPSGPRPAVGPPLGPGIPLYQNLDRDSRPPASQTIQSSTRLARPASEGSCTEPLVPPGLGLEAVSTLIDRV